MLLLRVQTCVSDLESFVRFVQGELPNDLSQTDTNGTWPGLFTKEMFGRIVCMLMALLVMTYMILMSDWESAALNGHAHPSIAVSHLHAYLSQCDIHLVNPLPPSFPSEPPPCYGCLRCVQPSYSCVHICNFEGAHVCIYMNSCEKQTSLTMLTFTTWDVRRKISLVRTTRILVRLCSMRIWQC